METAISTLSEDPVAETRIILFENMGAKGAGGCFRESRRSRSTEPRSRANSRPGESQSRQQRSGQRFQYGVCRLERGRRLDIVTFEFRAPGRESVVLAGTAATPDGVWELHEIGTMDLTK
jgi:hypothetical protein